MMNGKIQKIGRRLFVTLACVIFVLAMNLTTVFAATANIIFDNSPYSTTYQESSDEDANKLSFDVSINCDEKPGTYYIEMVYDMSRLQYTGGADREDNGVLVLEGTATASRIVYTLNFDVKSGGNAGIYVQYADITSADGTSKVDIGTMDYGTITIEGTDNSGAADFGHNVKDINTKIPFLGEVTINGTEYYVTDQSQYIPETADWTYQTAGGQFTLSDGTTKDITYLTGEDQRMHFLYLMDSVGEFHLFAVGTDGTFYPCVENGDYFYVSALAGQSLPDGMTTDDITKSNIVYLQYKDGTGTFVFRNSNGEFEVWSAESMNAANGAEDATASSAVNNDTKDDSDAGAKKDSDSKGFLSNISPRFIIVFVAVLVLFVLIILIVVKSKGKNEEPKRTHHRNHDERRKKRQDTIQRNRLGSSDDEKSEDDDLNLDDAEDLFFGFESAGEDAEETMRSAGEDAEETMRSVAEDAEETMQSAGEEAGEIMESAGEEAGEIMESAEEDAEETAEDDAGEIHAEYGLERAEIPAGPAARESGVTRDLSELDQRLSLIPDEPGVRSAEPLSFTAEIQMNLDAMEEDLEDDWISSDENVDDIDAAVDSFPDIEDENKENTIDFRKALEKALAEGKFDL